MCEEVSSVNSIDVASTWGEREGKGKIFLGNLPYFLHERLTFLHGSACPLLPLLPLALLPSLRPLLQVLRPLQYGGSSPAQAHYLVPPVPEILLAVHRLVRWSLVPPLLLPLLRIQSLLPPLLVCLPLILLHCHRFWLFFSFVYLVVCLRQFLWFVPESVLNKEIVNSSSLERT